MRPVCAEQAEAQRLREAAREDMRAARRHRRRARELMRQLDELIAACAERGIHIHINAKPQGGQADAHSRTEDRT